MKQVYVRASSLAEFFDCPSRWAAKHLGMLNLPASVPAVIGTAVHKSTAVYDQSRIDNSGLTPDDAAEALMEHLADPGEDVDWRGTSLNKAATTALGVHARYCTEIAPQHTYVAVEQRVDEMTIDWEELGISITLTGTLDRMFERDGKLGVADLKTGARALTQNSGKHRAQLGVYELLAEEMVRKNGATIELPGELIKLQTSSNYDVAVDPVQDARLVLLGDELHTGMLTHLARALKTGDFWGNPSSWLCSEKYCPAWQNCFFR